MKSCKIIASLFLLISVAAFGADHTDWTYDPKAGTLTSYDVSDTTKIVWQFVKVTCDGNMLTISRQTSSTENHIAPSEPTSLDFSKPITDTDGKDYYLQKFLQNSSSTNTEKSIFNDTRDDIKNSSKVSELILPKTFDTAEAGTIQYFTSCSFFDFRGDLKSINTRMFYKTYACRRIRFHYFPPKPTNTSYVFQECGDNKTGTSTNTDDKQGNNGYRYRMEYPKFLEDAWLNSTYKTEDGSYCARYGLKFDGKDEDIDMNKYPYNVAKTRYQSAFKTFYGVPNNTDVPLPAGWALLNYTSSISGVPNVVPNGKMALEPFDEENPTDKVVLGVMGLPYDISQEAMKQKDYEYGYHEYDVGNNGTKTLPIARPKRFVKIIDEEGVEKWYTCVGYKLFKDSNAVDYEIETNTPDEIIPFDQDVTVGPGNYGLTWIWEEGAPGFRITIR